MVENRTEKIIFRLSPFEKQQLQTYSENSYMTLSEFIRQSIFDKIRRIKYPSLNNNIEYQYNKEIIKNQKERDDIIENIGKKLNNFQRTIQQLKPLIKESKVIKDMEIVDNILKKHNGLFKITKLMKETGLNGLLYDVLAYFPNKYSVNRYNEVKLNELFK